MSSEFGLREARIVVGWFLSAWEDRDYPASSGPGDPVEAHNPRWEAVSELREQTGIDLTELHQDLVGEADQVVLAALPEIDCNAPPPCPPVESVDMNDVRAALTFPASEESP